MLKQKVFQEVCKIPKGKTKTYKEIAKKAKDKPKSCSQNSLTKYLSNKNPVPSCYKKQWKNRRLHIQRKTQR